MAMPKKYDYAQICSDRGIKYLYEENPYIFVSDEFDFTHKMDRLNLAKGSCPNFKSVQGDKTEYFKNVFKKKHGDQSHLFDFGDFTYIKSLNYSKVNCVKHGEYTTKPNWLLTRGHHCEQCAEDNRSSRKFLGTDGFIEKASTVHGDKYDYSNSEYLGAREYISIVCETHGIFDQIPYYHLAGNGCPECGKLTGGYGASDYDRVCPEGSNVYLMKIESDNEMFYKIGISKEPFKRSRDINRSSQYSSTVLKYNFHKDAKVIWRIEKDLHDLFSDFKYVPQNSFDGCTECFSFVCKDEFKELCEAYLQ